MGPRISARAPAIPCTSSHHFKRFDVLPLGIAVIDHKSFKDHCHEQEHESDGGEEQILGDGRDHGIRFKGRGPIESGI